MRAFVVAEDTTWTLIFMRNSVCAGSSIGAPLVRHGLPEAMAILLRCYGTRVREHSMRELPTCNWLRSIILPGTSYY